MHGSRVLKIVFVAGVLALVLGASQAMAQTIAVTATVGRHCVLGAGTLDFGDYDPLAATADTTQGTFTVRCTRSTTPAQIGLDNGGGWDGTTRRMQAAGPQYLNYALYQDVAHSTPWTTTSRWTVDGTTAANQTLTVYGVIPAGQDKPADLAFADTVNITVVF